MLAKETVGFLKKLDKNNNRDWFNANKDVFIKANDNVIAVTGELLSRVTKFDPEVSGIDPKSCVFRIYRDVRFAKDKSPYKTNLGAFIAPGGKKAMMPGYYFHVQPAMYFSAAGKHMPDSSELLKIRNAIAASTMEFLKIVNAKAFKTRFGDLDGDRLTKPPKGFAADHEAIEYLKLKSFTVTEEFTEKEATGKDYPKLLAESFKAAYPLVQFLRKALA
ncbi:MAG TPA: DUF2461 domain-containing protein [Pyrinomonadaceae bacterium]|nr:DUF2461 domain-containing protein [Pyrinomonadaceae bacterium]